MIVAFVRFRCCETSLVCLLQGVCASDSSGLDAVLVEWKCSSLVSGSTAAMDYDTFLVVMAFGMVGAGLVHSLWLWLGATRPSFVSIVDEGPRLMVPLRVFGVMFAAPLILAGAALNHLAHGWRYVWLTLLGLVTSLLWCFMSGIVLIVLTDVAMSL
jgi:hypothetical protein